MDRQYDRGIYITLRLSVRNTEQTEILADRNMQAAVLRQTGDDVVLKHYDKEIEGGRKG